VEFFGKYRLKEISPFLVESFKTRRRKMPVVYTKQTAPGVYEHREKQRSAASVNRELQLLSRIFSLADVENPCSKVDLVKGEKKRKRYLLPEERQRLIQAIEAPGREWLARIVLVDLYAGLRRNELLGLRPEHIDFARNIIRVRGAKSEIDLGTKTDEDREVYMNTTVRGILTEQVADAEAMAGRTRSLILEPALGIRISRTVSSASFEPPELTTSGSTTFATRSLLEQVAIHRW
jgi:integrase